MRKFKFLFIILAGLLLTSCKSEFTIDFELPKDISTVCRVVYYASSKKQGLMMEMTAEIRDGKATLRCPTRFPAVVYLFQQSSSTPALIFYVSRGDNIKIAGESMNAAEWTVKGNSLSEEWTKWRLDNQEALRSGNAEKINKAIASYVEKNPSSKLSTALLILQYSRREDEAGFLKLFNSLKSGATSDKDLMAALAVADMPGGELSQGGKPNTMVLTSPSGDPDTLKFAGKPSLIIFSESRRDDNSLAERDSLRALLRAYPDSASRMIAKISFDADSLSWINSVKNDSLRNVARGWMPAGVADSIAMALGVKRTPYYIVADTKGNRVYGGSDIKKAISEFKKTAHKQ